MKTIYGNRITSSMAAVVVLLGCANRLKADEKATDVESRSDKRESIFQNGPQTRILVRKKKSDDGEAAVTAQVLVRRQEHGKYWIGLYCLPVSPALRSHLNLKQGQGLMVDHVVEKTPAAKAGIQRFDVLLKVGDTELSDIRDLVKAVQAAGKDEKQLSLQLIRGAKLQSVNITPSERADVEVPHDVLLRHQDEVRKHLEFWGGIGRPNIKFRLIRPGILLDQTLSGIRPQQPSHLPDDLSITITRTGKQPAKIVVKKDDKSWIISENQLDQLPKQVRPHVERLLRRPVFSRERIKRLKDLGIPIPPGDRIIKRRSQIQPKDPPPLEKRIDEIDRKLEELREAIEKLGKSKEIKL